MGNKIISTVLAALLMLGTPGGAVFAAPIARVNLGSVNLGVNAMGPIAAPGNSAGYRVGSLEMTVSPGLSASSLVIPQEAVIAHAPTAAAAAPQAAPVVMEAAAALSPSAAPQAVERHPVIGIVNDIQRAGGQKLLNQFTGAESVQDLKEIAAAMPEGSAKRDLAAFASRLSMPNGGATRLSEVFDGGKAGNDRSAKPQQEAVEASGFYAWLSNPKGWRPIAGLRKWAAAKAEAARPKAGKMDTDQFLLKGQDVRWTPNKADLPNKASEAEISHKGVVGQDAALEAIEFGLELWERGYNVIVSGPNGTGRETAIRQILPSIAAQRPTPNDVVAVTNLSNPDAPILLEMEPGEGIEFQAGVEAVLDNAGPMLQKVFSTGQYAQMRKKLEASLQNNVADRQKAIERKVAKVKIKGEWGLRIQVQQMDEDQFGIIAELLFNGEAVKAEDIDAKLEGKPYTKEELMAELQEASKPLTREYGEMMQKNMEEQAEVMAKLQQVEGQLAAQVFGQLAAPVFQLVSGAPSHEDAAHEEWREHQKQTWAEFNAKIKAAAIGKFHLAFTKDGNIVMVYGEKTVVTPKVFEELKAKGVVSAEEKFEEYVQRALAIAEPLLQERQAIEAKINAEHEALHKNDPPMSASRNQAVQWLKGFLQHITSNYAGFVEGPDPKNPMATDPAESVKVSVLADNSRTKGAPIVMEHAPSFANLFGEAESGKQMIMVPGMSAPIRRNAPGGPGLKAGSYIKARGGYLVLDLLETLREGTYPYLMRMVRSGQAEIAEGGAAGMVSKQGELYSVPMQGENMVKIVFIASPMMRMMLEQNDEDFGGLFRVAAEFERSFDIASETIKAYLSFLRTQIQRSAGKLLDMSQGAVARVLEEAANMAGSNRKITAQFGAITSLLLEASHFAGKAGRDMVEAEDIDKAVHGRSTRGGDIKKAVLERYTDKIFLISVEGEVQGQNNGLAVIGNDFGVPTRITYEAGVRSGSRLIVSTDQDAHSTGSSFDKSVGVIQGYLKRTFGRTQNIPAEVSIEFAQQYGGIDGDSATQTMTYGVLSAYSGAKIKQGIAMTGSMNQKGEVQVIGGVNHKITGFFDVTVELLAKEGKELNGEQGVIIPEANVGDLMLRPDIAKAVQDGKFKIWAISHVSQGVEILMDMPYSEVIRESKKYFAQIRREAGNGGK